MAAVMMQSRVHNNNLAVLDDDMDVSSDVGKQDRQQDIDIDIDFDEPHVVPHTDDSMIDDDLDNLHETSLQSYAYVQDDDMVDEVDFGTAMAEPEMLTDWHDEGEDEELQDVVVADDGESDIEIIDENINEHVGRHELEQPTLETKVDSLHTQREIQNPQVPLLTADIGTSVEAQIDAQEVLEITQDSSNVLLPLQPAADVLAQKSEIPQIFVEAIDEGDITPSSIVVKEQTEHTTEEHSHGDVDVAPQTENDFVQVEETPGFSDALTVAQEEARSAPAPTEYVVEDKSNDLTGTSTIVRSPTEGERAAFVVAQHPVIVIFDGQEFDLFPADDETENYLLNDRSLLSAKLPDFLSSCRVALGTNITDSEELEISVEQLGLSLNEVRLD